MDLIDCASWFDSTRVQYMDPSHPVFDLNDFPGNLQTFMGQLDVYDDSKRDGVGTERRVLSVDPRVALPNKLLQNAGGVVFINREPWIMSTLRMPDVFGDDGAAVRHKYVVQRAPFQCQVYDAASLLYADIYGDADPYTWCDIVFTKDQKYESSSSTLRTESTLWVDPGHMPDSDNGVVFIRYRKQGEVDSRISIARNAYVGSTGLAAVEVVTLHSNLTLQPVNYVSVQGFDPVAGRAASTAPVSVRAIVMPFFEHYENLAHATPKPAGGDMTLLVSPSEVADPKVGDTYAVYPLSGGDPIVMRAVQIALRDSTGLTRVQVTR